ncbi:hypothetical protein D3C71_1954740 [compost metagenome]
MVHQTEEVTTAGRFQYLILQCWRQADQPLIVITTQRNVKGDQTFIGADTGMFAVKHRTGTHAKADQKRILLLRVRTMEPVAVA